MAEFDVQAALERIEGKLDTTIVNHGERIAKAETNVESLKDDLKDRKVVGWIQFAGATLLSVGGHLGLRKVGL
jgi:hypothetical protein